MANLLVCRNRFWMLILLASLIGPVSSANADVFTPQERAKMALLASAVERMFTTDKAAMEPELHRMIAQDWKKIGYIRGTDAPLLTRAVKGNTAGERVFYGILAQSKTDTSHYIVLLKGTETLKEWAEDFEARPTTFYDAWDLPHGKVPEGFSNVYYSLKYYEKGKYPLPAAAGIANAIGRTGRVDIVAHSLGVALATYLTLDLKMHPDLSNVTVKMLGFASPRPGNQAFCDFFDTRLSHNDYEILNYKNDLITKVPPIFEPLSNTIPLRNINDDPPGLVSRVTMMTPPWWNLVAKVTAKECSHHATSYAKMCDEHVDCSLLHPREIDLLTKCGLDEPSAPPAILQH